MCMENGWTGIRNNQSGIIAELIEQRAEISGWTACKINQYAVIF